MARGNCEKNRVRKGEKHDDGKIQRRMLRLSQERGDAVSMLHNEETGGMGVRTG